MGKGVKAAEATERVPVHAVTVVTLLEKLSTMLEAVRERQGGPARSQGCLTGTIQRGLGGLSRSHGYTSNKQLETNHVLLVAFGQLHVQLFKEEAEIPSRAFQKEPEHTELEEKELGPEAPEELEERESSDEESVESRAKRLQSTGLENVQSLRRALSTRKSKAPAPPPPTPTKPPRLGPGQGVKNQPETGVVVEVEPGLELEPQRSPVEEPENPEARETLMLQEEDTA